VEEYNELQDPRSNSWK